MVDDEFFRDAGKRMRNKAVAAIAEHDQSLAALKAFSTQAEAGIKLIYGDDSRKPRVVSYDTHVAVIYNVRWCTSGGQLDLFDGPVALFIVNPDGTMGWASNTTWRHRGTRGDALRSSEISSQGVEDKLAQLLVEFVEKTEDESRKLCA